MQVQIFEVLGFYNEKSEKTDSIIYDLKCKNPNLDITKIDITKTDMKKYPDAVESLKGIKPYDMPLIMIDGKVCDVKKLRGLI